MENEIRDALTEWESAVEEANRYETELFDADNRPLLTQKNGARVWARLDKAHARLTELGQQFLSAGEVLAPALYLEILRPKEARA